MNWIVQRSCVWFLIMMIFPPWVSSYCSVCAFIVTSINNAIGGMNQRLSEHSAFVFDWCHLTTQMILVESINNERGLLLFSSILNRFWSWELALLLIYDYRMTLSNILVRRVSKRMTCTIVFCDPCWKEDETIRKSSHVLVLHNWHLTGIVLC